MSDKENRPVRGSGIVGIVQNPSSTGHLVGRDTIRPIAPPIEVSIAEEMARGKWRTLLSQQQVSRLEVSVNDRWLGFVQKFERICDLIGRTIEYLNIVFNRGSRLRRALRHSKLYLCAPLQIKLDRQRLPSPHIHHLHVFWQLICLIWSKVALDIMERVHQRKQKPLPCPFHRGLELL
jgi:hypothetical protein